MRLGSHNREIQSWIRIIVPVMLALAGVAAFAVDLPVASWSMAEKLPKELTRLLFAVEGVGTGHGVLVVAAAVWFLDPARRIRLGGLLTAALGAGLMADAIKLFVGRYRPVSNVVVESVWQTFGQEVANISQTHHLQSFPSAHSATAFGLMIALNRLYPRGRPIFIFLAVCIAWSRVNCGAHYLSDALLGAALGMAFGSLAAHWLLPKDSAEAGDLKPVLNDAAARHRAA